MFYVMIFLFLCACVCDVYVLCDDIYVLCAIVEK
jgi:hypothetical protein